MNHPHTTTHPRSHHTSACTPTVHPPIFHNSGRPCCHQGVYFGDVCTHLEDAQCCVLFDLGVIGGVTELGPSTHVFCLGIFVMEYCCWHHWWLGVLERWVVGEFETVMELTGLTIVWITVVHIRQITVVCLVDNAGSIVCFVCLVVVFWHLGWCWFCHCGWPCCCCLHVRYCRGCRLLSRHY